MGYRSEVAYAIVFKNHEDKTKIIDRLTPRQWEIIREDGAVIEHDRILYHADDIKWYSTRELGQYNLQGYEVVDAHDALIQAARDAEEAYTGDADLVHLADEEAAPEGVYSLGIFVRLGEEDDDTEREAWGYYDPPEGFPEIYDLVDYNRSLTVGWSE